jgi:hypothetical protein
MPRLSRLLIRSALLYLLAGFTIGGLMLFNKGVPLAPALWSLLPAHIEFVLVGWTLQLAMGMAFWILPRWGGSRGNERLAWLAYGALNLGVLAAALANWLPAAGLWLLLGRAAELAAALLFALHAWPRVKPLGA